MRTPALSPEDVARDADWHALPLDPPALGAAVMIDEALAGVILIQAPASEAAGYEVAMDALRRALQDSLRAERQRPVLRLERPNRLLTYVRG